MKLCKLKPSKLAIATSLALAALSGQALAVAPPINSVPDVDIFLSGASAPQNTLGALAGLLFGPNVNFNNYHVLYDHVTPGVGLGTDHRSYYGTLVSNFTVPNSNPVRTLTAGTTVMLSNRARGGSVYGVNPIAESFPIATIRPSATAPANSGCVVANPVSTVYSHTCPVVGTDGTSGRRPDFGVSDVHPNMFKATFNKEPGALAIFDALTQLELNRLTVTSVFGLEFGVPATISVPSTLNTTNNGAVTGFTKAMYASLLAGNIVDWSQIDSAINTGNTGVVICRRSQGSGTQATYNAYFNNWPCTLNSVIPNSNTAPARMDGSFDIAGFTPGTTSAITITPTPGNTAGGSFTVIENPSSGNVRDCLWKAQTNQNHTFNWTDDLGSVHPVTVVFSNSANPYRAIGTLSNDSTEGHNGSANIQTSSWTFRNLNDVPGVIAGLPNKTAVRNGRWDFVSEVTMQYRNDGYISTAGIFVSGAAPAGVERDRRDFADVFIQRSGDPEILRQIPNLVTRAATIAIPSSTYNPSLNDNVAFVTRGGNMCAPNQWIGF